MACFAFFLKNQVPSDPAQTILNLQGMDDSTDGYEEAYHDKYIELGLDLPEFYLTISSNYNSWLSDFSGSQAEAILAKEWSSKKYSKKIILEFISASNSLSNLQKRFLYNAKSPSDVKYVLEGPQFQNQDSNLLSSLIKLSSTADQSKVKWHYPTLTFNGANNQFHRWIEGIVSGDFGVSLVDARPVFSKIWDAFKWTIWLVVFSLLISLFLAFLIGVYNGTHVGGRFDRVSNALLFLFYSIPKFWLATLMIIFFTSAEYGAWTNVFPSVGIWNTTSGQGFWSMLIGSVDKMILPLLVIIIPDVAYLSRLIRSSIIEENNKEYIKTAVSKGVSNRQIVRRHLIPNSLIPTITLLAGVIPGALGSSLIIEVIFNIPGIGRLMYNSILTADWAVVFPIILLVGLVAVIIFLLADILIAWLNPKINLG